MPTTTKGPQYVVTYPTKYRPAEVSRLTEFIRAKLENGDRVIAVPSGVTIDRLDNNPFPVDDKSAGLER